MISNEKTLIEVSFNPDANLEPQRFLRSLFSGCKSCDDFQHDCRPLFCISGCGGTTRGKVTVHC